MFDEPLRKVYVTTVSKVIKNLSTIENCPLEQFQEEIVDQFAGYNYEGEDEVIGFEKWPDNLIDGEYELCVKVDHEDAYEFTLHTKIEDGKATVTNVL